MIRLSDHQKAVIDALNEVFPAGTPFDPKSLYGSTRLEEENLDFDRIPEILRTLEVLGYISHLVVSSEGIAEHLVIEDPVRTRKELIKDAQKELRRNWWVNNWIPLLAMLISLGSWLTAIAALLVSLD